MRIENINKENIKELVPVELRNTKLRFMQIFDNHFSDPMVKEAVDLDRYTFFRKYMILRDEMHSRDIKYMEDSALDKARDVNIRAFLKSVYGIDVPALDELPIVKSYIAISGEFMRMPKVAKQVDVVVRNLEENKDVLLEKKIGMLIKAKTGKEPNFIYRPEGPDKTYMPVFDLVLRASGEIEVIKMAKTLVSKGAIGFKDLGTAEEGTAWAGAKETVKAEVEDLRQICAWYDAAKPDIKASYKLPHHRMSDKKAIWHGVSAAMGALLGARGGVDIPVADKKGVYNHLAGHYKQFDKEVPELRKYDAEELEKAFPIEKPEESETTIRIPVGGECEVTATITIDKTQGIKALYCGKIKKIRTYLFDKRVKAWTMATAKAWVKEHHTAKMEKKISVIMQKNSENAAKFMITKIDKKKQIVGGVVYEPDEVDTQGDYTDKKEIEKAHIHFMEKYATDTKRIRISHKGRKLFFPIIESFIPEHDTTKGDKALKADSWWLEIKVTNPKIWEAIEAGKLTGFSMGGRAKA